jgi:REP element-mobilizing transposase RayT
MQRIRLTYAGALHHAMNRGHGGEKIFSGSGLKKVFIDILTETSRKLKIKIIAYCLMDNHYHLVLENSSGRLSEFFKHLNGRFGIVYRKKKGGKGYVFQNRYKSEIIQDESYLITVIAYVLMNPVRAGMTADFMTYPWSSAQSYYQGENPVVDREYVQGLFGSKRNFISQVQGLGDKELQLLQTDVGDVIGSEGFAEKALERFERRSGEDGLERKRTDDRYFDPLAKIIQEFERMKGIDIDKIDVGKYAGKQLRGELLVYLKDNGGLTYREIAEMFVFRDIQMASLGKLYQDALRRFKRRSQEVKHRAG